MAPGSKGCETLQEAARTMSHALSGSRVALLVALAAVGAALYSYYTEEQQPTGPPDLYSVLGVRADSSTADIKAAYRKLAVKMHPDKNPGCTTCAQDFSEVAKAYEVLSEPVRRQQCEPHRPRTLWRLLTPAQV
jgi:preprotein translocase subunit Sec63